jgi:lipoate-protein ligase A
MQLLDWTLPTAPENLACDEALLDGAEAGECGEVLRFWEPRNYFVVVGYANHISREVRVEVCEERAIPILRRCSGGGTVLQGPGCMNYTLVLKIELGSPTANIAQANRWIMERHRAALELAMKGTAAGNAGGARVCVEGHTDLALGSLKVSGNAQRRRQRFLLFHGTFLLHLDLSLISQYLREPSQRPAYREERVHKDFVANLDLAPEVVKRALRRTWGVTELMKEGPVARVGSLTADKYGKREWNLKFE